MKNSLARVLIILTLSTLAHAQSASQAAATGTQSVDQRASNEELHKAFQALKAKQFDEAQRHFEKALEIDPSNKTALFFIARSIDSRYRRGDETPENIAKARQAIAMYKRILVIEPENDEAFEAVSHLFQDIMEIELQYDWILERAVNAAVSSRKRSGAYVMLAERDWYCSVSITEGPDNKQVARMSRGDNIVVYTKPQKQFYFDKAQQCATRGLDMVEAAITLDPANTYAWSFKVNLLLEMAKLAEMEGNIDKRDEFRRLAIAAQKRAGELTKLQQNLDVVTPESSSAVASSDSGAITGSVIVGKAIRLPKPEYPAKAIKAKAKGTVVVQVIIDEKGKVISAAAVSGHPLLRAAAVEAARQAHFTPTILSGQPVKVVGTINYNFNSPAVVNDDRPPTKQ